MADTPLSLGLALPKEMARVRDDVMPAFIAIGDPGKVALTMMRWELDQATKAMMEGDVPGMLRAYNSLKGFTA